MVHIRHTTNLQKHIGINNYIKYNLLLFIIVFVYISFIIIMNSLKL